MGSSGQTTSTQKFQPPAWMMPDIQKYLTELNTIDNPFGGQQVPQQQTAGLSDLQNWGLGMLGNEAGQAGQFGKQAMGTAGDILGGKYLDPSSNKYLNDYYNQAAAGLVNNYQMATSPDITAQAVQQGGLGGSGQNQSQQYAKWSLGQNLGNLAAGIYEPAYQAGLNQMTSVLDMSPKLQAGAFTPSQGLLGGGALQQQQLQNQLNALYQNQMGQFQLPYSQLNTYGSGVQGMAGLGGTTIGTQSLPGSMK